MSEMQGPTRRDILKGGLAAASLILMGQAGNLVGSGEAYAKESLPHLDLPDYVKPFVKLYKMTDEIKAFVNTYGFFERHDALVKDKVSWTAVKRQLRGALYIEAGDVSYDKEFGSMINKCMSILESAPRELINAIDRDVTLSPEQKQKVKNTYAAEVLRQFVIKPTMARDMKELPKWVERQQARMACPTKEDDFNGGAGFYSIATADIARDIILMYTKNAAGQLEYTLPSRYPDFNFKLANAEAMEVVDALRGDDSILPKPLSKNRMLVIVQQQPEDREKHFEGGWCVGYGQVNVKDPNPTINFVDAQLGGFVEKVRWDRIRRVTILEPIDPKIDSNDKSGERESYRIN